MSNYKETAVSGDSWVRAKSLFINNERGSVPAVTFNEERIINAGGIEFAQHLGSVCEPFTPENVTEPFDLVNPLTGEVVGQMTYQDVYAALHSLYLHVAGKRDAMAG